MVQLSETGVQQEADYKPLKKADFEEIVRHLGWERTAHYQVGTVSDKKDHVELISPSGLYINVGLDEQTVAVSQMGAKRSFSISKLRVDKLALTTGMSPVKNKQLTFSGEDQITVDSESNVRAVIDNRIITWTPQYEVDGSNP